MKQNPTSCVLQLQLLTQQLQEVVEQQAWEQLVALDQQCHEAIAKLTPKASPQPEVIEALTQLHGCYQQTINQYEQHRQQLAKQLKQCQKGLQGVTAYQQVQN